MVSEGGRTSGCDRCGVSCKPENYIMLLTIVTPNELKKKKRKKINSLALPHSKKSVSFHLFLGSSVS